MIRQAFVVRGRVQGVGYRHFVRAAALCLGIGGWVQNAADGSVQGEAEGEAAAIDEFLAALRRGPIAARVDSVTTAALPGCGDREFAVWNALGQS